MPARIAFAGGSTELPDQAKPVLQNIVQALKSDTQLRVQLVAYASGDGDQASQARRVSLARAIAIRSFLIDNGIPSTRIEVRALGNRTESGAAAADRVDILAATG